MKIDEALVEKFSSLIKMQNDLQELVLEEEEKFEKVSDFEKIKSKEFLSLRSKINETSDGIISYRKSHEFESIASKYPSQLRALHYHLANALMMESYETALEYKSKIDSFEAF